MNWSTLDTSMKIQVNFDEIETLFPWLEPKCDNKLYLGHVIGQSNRFCSNFMHMKQGIPKEKKCNGTLLCLRPHKKGQ